MLSLEYLQQYFFPLSSKLYSFSKMSNILDIVTCGLRIEDRPRPAGEGNYTLHVAIIPIDVKKTYRCKPFIYAFGNKNIRRTRGPVKGFQAVGTQEGGSRWGRDPPLLQRQPLRFLQNAVELLPKGVKGHGLSKFHGSSYLSYFTNQLYFIYRIF